MRLSHLGHRLVFTSNQFAVSLSSLHFCSHIISISQVHGSCACSPQRKQKGSPHVQWTLVIPVPTATLSHPADGQRCINLHDSMKFLTQNSWYLLPTAGSTSIRKKDSGTLSGHLVSGHRVLTQDKPSDITLLDK